MKYKQKHPDTLIDQLTGFLARRKEQPITQELIEDFALYLWPRKKKSDLLVMKEMMNAKENFNYLKYESAT